VVFSQLNREQFCEILELELRQVQMRILQTAKVPFLFRVGAAGRESSCLAKERTRVTVHAI